MWEFLTKILTYDGGGIALFLLVFIIIGSTAEIIKTFINRNKPSCHDKDNKDD